MPSLVTVFDSLMITIKMRLILPTHLQMDIWAASRSNL